MRRHLVLGLRLAAAYRGRAALPLLDLARGRNAVRFDYGGARYLMAPDGSTGEHLVNSLSKLKRLSDLVGQEDEVVLDVGAHSGLFGAFVKQRFPATRVVAVEANPRLVPVVRRNLEMRPGQPSQVIAAAAGAAAGSATFYRNAEMTQTSSLLQDAAEEFGRAEGFEVPVTTVDDVVEQLGLPRVDVLKLDVQGAEAMVLDGAAKTLPGVRKLLAECTFMDPDPAALLVRLEEAFGPPEAINPVYMGADLLYRRP